MASACDLGVQRAPLPVFEDFDVRRRVRVEPDALGDSSGFQRDADQLAPCIACIEVEPRRRAPRLRPVDEIARDLGGGMAPMTIRAWLLKDNPGLYRAHWQGEERRHQGEMPEGAPGPTEAESASAHACAQDEATSVV